MLETQQLRKQRLKVKNQVINRIRHLLKRLDQGLTLTNLRLTERYDEVALQIILHFRFGKGKDYVAFFQREDRRVEGNKKTFGVRNRLRRMADYEPLNESRPLTWRDTAKVIRISNSDKKSVLVNVVEFIEEPKRVIPSLVWFDRLDSAYSLLPHALYFSRALGFEYRGTLTDWKGSLVGGNVARGQDKLPSQMVKGTSEILQRIASNDRKTQRSFREISDIKLNLSRLRIFLGPDYIWPREAKAEGVNLSLEITVVLFGPFNFYED